MSYSKPTLHMIGLFHTIPNHEFDHCAFTGKVLRFAKMMRMQGYEVIEYSNGESLSEANKHVQILTRDELFKHTTTDTVRGKIPWIGSDFWRSFHTILIEKLKLNVKDGDIICHPFGYTHSELVKLFPNQFHVETGIGYPQGDFGAFRIYESYAWMHFHQGKYISYDENKKPMLDQNGEVISGRFGRDYEWVVPNYYNLDDWEPNYEKGKYLLYFGRVIEEKGLYIIKEIATHLGINEPIRIVGLGDLDKFEGRNMQIEGPIVGVKERSDLLRNARAVLMPTRFVEPFGGVAIEAMLCGTPVIASDFGAFTETLEHGKTGFRCHTLGDYLAAIIAAENLDRKYISDRARSLYSLEAVGKRYDAVFKQIYDLKEKGWYTKNSHYIEEPHLIWEQRWWGDCKDTRHEENKQKVYAKYMGLGVDVDNDVIYFNAPYATSKRVIDIGGGPVSMLLKITKNEVKDSKVYDPSTYPDWTMKRYQDHGIEYVKKVGEEINETGYDEVWIYNCLQHTEDPEKIIQNAKRAGKVLRIFEWVDTPPELGHPQSLNQDNLEKWIGQKGNVAFINENGAIGKCFYGVFEFKN